MGLRSDAIPPESRVRPSRPYSKSLWRWISHQSIRISAFRRRLATARVCCTSLNGERSPQTALSPAARVRRSGTVSRRTDTTYVSSQVGLVELVGCSDEQPRQCSKSEALDRLQKLPNAE